MADIPHDPNSQTQDTPAPDRLKRVREAAQAGYGLTEATVAAKSRESRRAERERKAYDSHYLGTPPDPQ